MPGNWTARTQWVFFCSLGSLICTFGLVPFKSLFKVQKFKVNSPADWENGQISGSDQIPNGRGNEGGVDKVK